MSHQLEGEFDSVERAIEAIADGRIVIVTDDEDRENEGDLIFAAEKATAELVNLMIRYCSGVVCVPCAEPQLKRLGLTPMVPHNRESYRTDYTVSVDAAEGITTGISAFDRAETIRRIASRKTTPEDLIQPGHVFPLRSKPGGVLERSGHTEAAVDLAQLAGLFPAGVLCEVVNQDGTMARLPQLVEFKKRFDLPLISIASLIEYRHQREKLVEQVARQPFRSAFGDFEMYVFRSKIDSRHHIAFVKGEVSGEPTLVRVQSENRFTGRFSRQAGGRVLQFERCLRENFPGRPWGGALHGAGQGRVGFWKVRVTGLRSRYRVWISGTMGLAHKSWWRWALKKYGSCPVRCEKW